MEIQYQLTEEEFVHAQLQFCSKVKRGNRLLLQVSLGLFSLILGITGLLITGYRDLDFGLSNHIAEWFIIGMGLFFLADRYWIAPYRIRRIFRRSPNTSCQRRLALSDAGIKTILPNSTDDVRWEAFQKAYDLADMFLIMYGPVQFYIIPQRAFDSAGLEQFRLILREKGLLKK